MLPHFAGLVKTQFRLFLGQFFRAVTALFFVNFFPIFGVIPLFCRRPITRGQELMLPQPEAFVKPQFSDKKTANLAVAADI
jgi:hypothetical protein